MPSGDPAHLSWLASSEPPPAATVGSVLVRYSSINEDKSVRGWTEPSARLDATAALTVASEKATHDARHRSVRPQGKGVDMGRETLYAL